MRKVEWIADDIFFDEHGRLHILNPTLVERIKGITSLNAAPIEINERSVVVGAIPVPGPKNPSCPDALCVCRPGKITKEDPIARAKATKAQSTARARKPTANL